MELPDEDVEFSIMMNERFGMKNGNGRKKTWSCISLLRRT